MSATEEDTELRDLLIQNLENSGVLNKIKAELRAAVFVALEEQEKQEKPPLDNECLKKCLNTKDGRLAASLISDFLQVYNLDFTLAVFQPEINLSVDVRESVCRDLGVHDGDGNRSSPLLLEVIRRSRHREKSFPTTNEGEKVSQMAKELSPRQIAEARRKFDAHSKDKTGVKTEELTAVFVDVCPAFSRSMLECFVKDELAARDASSMVDFQEFLGILKRFFMQCRSVVMSDAGDAPSSAVRGFEDRISSQPLSRVLSDAGDTPPTAVRGLEDRISGHSLSRDTEIPRFKGQPVELDTQASEVKGQVGGAALGDGVGGSQRKTAELQEEEDDEGDSFFDDPLPKPQKTYGCRLSSVDRSVSEKSISQRDKHRSTGSEGRAAGGAVSDASKKTDRNDEEVNYDDDFNSHRSENSRSEISIGEEIEEGSLEGPDFSEKVDSTLDVSVSQLSEGADYLEEVS
ncbi:FGFR1 oncogene partner isoform X2 [Clupea harengus]|uniref:Centrosomal protein 43 n=1 Tax=Clupea harengus TaxID=7950 RepID=A0A6P8GJF4_CLUHA|nr:FGFR1 oncogene partner isoform X2 [Clupea harengus]